MDFWCKPICIHFMLRKMPSSFLHESTTARGKKTLCGAKSLVALMSDLWQLEVEMLLINLHKKC